MNAVFVRRRFLRSGVILAIICIVAATLMSWAAWTDSATYDEVAHIPAGYGYVRYLSFNLNPEHPPLVKALAMIPVAVFVHPDFPVQNISWQTETNDEYAVGDQFLYESGNNANTIIRVARIVPILVTLLTIVFTYLLAQMLIGEWWALLPAFLFALDPTVLANGHYVTTDVGATLGIVMAIYYFLKFAASPSSKNLWYAGIAFGIAQLTKFSAVILIPFFVLLLFIQRNIEGERMIPEKINSIAKRHILWIFLIGYGLVVYPIYALFTLHYPIAKQASDTQAILTLLTGGSKSLINSFCIWMAGNPLLRPLAEYFLGFLMVFTRVNGGSLIYAFGNVSFTGGWQYFPLIFLLKEPIPTLIIIIAALLFALFSIVQKLSSRNSFHWTERGDRIFIIFSLLSFIIVYWIISMASPLDLGIRYLIPSIPFIYVLAAYVWKTGANRLRRLKIGYVVLGSLLIWLVGETLFAAPYFLSYFNEFGGGTWYGYRIADNSNYDWNQDLLRLQSWVAAHPDVDKIAVDYFGRANPLPYYFGNQAVPWSSADGNPTDQNIHWIAISIDTLERATQPTAPGVARNASDTYSWLTILHPPALGMGNVPTPDYRVGTSIFIYHL